MNKYIIIYIQNGHKTACEITAAAPSLAMEQFKKLHPTGVIWEIKKGE